MNRHEAVHPAERSVRVYEDTSFRLRQETVCSENKLHHVRYLMLCEVVSLANPFDLTTLHRLLLCRNRFTVIN